jgi:hypothetical protein|tara:strand:+ start:14033 stop:14893 length:861 start_codon:yes stop_codon:yes gene_type:complete
MSNLMCLERDDSGEITLDPPSIELKWDIIKRPTATDRTPIDRDEAIQKLQLTAPFVMNIATEVEDLVQGEITLSPNKRFGLVATINYRLADEVTPGSNNSEVGMLSFGISSENIHITQALLTISRTPVAGVTAADYKGAIGADSEGNLTGCDIPAPKLSWSETVYRPLAYVSHGYVNTLGEIVGHWNLYTFRTKAPGSVLCAGVQGSANWEKKRWELTFNFEHSPNVEGITIGEITGIAKRGYDYLDVHYEQANDDDAKKLVPRPIQVDVLQVIDGRDFSGLGIGA